MSEVGDIDIRSVEYTGGHVEAPSTRALFTTRYRFLKSRYPKDM